MADTRSLRFIGIVYGVLTAAIVAIALLVVSGHLRGNLTLDDTDSPAVEMSASRR